MSNLRECAAFCLQAEGLAKSYGEKLALDHVSFEVNGGECLGIAGHNGSGKSTLLSLISQTLTPDAGDLQLSGASVFGDRRFLREEVGYVPQQDGLLPELRVEEMLRSWQALIQADDEAAYQAAVELMGLSPLLRKKIAQLSGGMKKRVSIALALLGSPRLLILDEVLSALDRNYCEGFLQYIQSFVAAGGGVLYCTHQKDEMLQICDRLLILKQGNVVFYDRIEALSAEALASDGLFSE